MRYFTAPPPAPKWKRGIQDLVSKIETEGFDWEVFERRVGEMAKAQPKKWGESKRKAWESTWLEVSKSLDKHLKTGADWQAWKSATVAWHKPMYEEGVCEWVFSLPPDDNADDRQKHWRERHRADELRNGGTKGVLKAIGSWGVSWQELGRLKDAGLPLNTPTSKRSSTLNAEFKKMDSRPWSDQEVFQKVLFAEWDNQFLPWQRFVVDEMNLKYSDITKRLGKADVSAEAFWCEEVLSLPITRHKHGGGYELSWCSDDLGVLWQTAHQKADGWGFYKEWADRHAKQDWPENVISQFWGNAVYMSEEKGVASFESTRTRAHRHWLLDHHFENATYTPMKESLGGKANFKKWRRDSAEEWADWMLTANQSIETHNFPYIWEGLSRPYSSLTNRVEHLFALATNAVSCGFLDIHTQSKNKPGQFDLFWMSSALDKQDVREWVEKQIEKHPRLGKEWISYFQDRKQDGKVAAWIGDQIPKWERAALIHQCVDPKRKNAVTNAL